MAITWQSVLPDNSSQINALTNANRLLSESVSDLGEAASGITESLAAKDQREAMKRLDSGLNEMALRADNLGDFQATGLTLAKSFGLSNEEAKNAVSSALDFRESTSVLSDEDMRKTELANAKIKANEDLAISKLNTEKEDELFKKGIAQKLDFYSKTPNFDKALSSASERIEDTDDRANFQAGIDKFRKDNPDVPLSDIASVLEVYGNPEEHTFFGFVDTVDVKDVSNKLGDLVGQIQADRNETIESKKLIDTEYSNKASENLQRFNAERSKVIDSDREKLKAQRLRNADLLSQSRQ